MPEFRNKVRFDGVFALKETDAALLVEVEGKQVWIPKSQVDDESEVYGEGHEGELVVSDWIAMQKGLT